MLISFGDYRRAKLNGERNIDCVPGVVHLPTSRVSRNATSVVWADVIDWELNVQIDVEHHSFHNAPQQMGL